jgi:hypothetical protein
MAMALRETKTIKPDIKRSIPEVFPSIRISPPTPGALAAITTRLHPMEAINL